MTPPKAVQPVMATVAFAVALYATCSSCMLVVNKVIRRPGIKRMHVSFSRSERMYHLKNAEAALRNRPCRPPPPPLFAPVLALNQVAITFVPAPAFLLFCQLASAAVSVFLAAAIGMVESNKLEWEKVNTSAVPRFPVPWLLPHSAGNRSQYDLLMIAPRSKLSSSWWWHLWGPLSQT